jgi:hypothetical protein
MTVALAVQQSARAPAQMAPKYIFLIKFLFNELGLTAPFEVI